MASGLDGVNRSLLPQKSPCSHGELGTKRTILWDLEELLIQLRSCPLETSYVPTGSGDLDVMCVGDLVATGGTQVLGSSGQNCGLPISCGTVPLRLHTILCCHHDRIFGGTGSSGHRND